MESHATLLEDASSKISTGLTSPYRLSLSLTPAFLRFRYDTTQTGTGGGKTDRSGEDIKLTQPESQSLLALRLDTNSPWHFSAEQFQASTEDQTYLTRKQYLFGVFPITLGANATARLDVDSLKLSAGRKFWGNAQGELGLLFGVKVIRANWSLASSNPAVQLSTRDEDTLALPSLGFFGDRQLSKHAYISLKADYFSLERPNLKGRAYDLKATYEYRPTAALTLSSGLALSQIDVLLNKRDYQREIRLGHGGPYMGLRYVF